jgi:hypothetical protein
VPRDYQLLVPREWFRIDLMQDRWRAQLKTFVDRQAEGRCVPAELQHDVLATLRNTAEAGRARGAMEFFLPGSNFGSLKAQGGGTCRWWVFPPEPRCAFSVPRRWTCMP